MVEFLCHGHGSPAYDSGQLALLNADLRAVESGSITDFRQLHRFTQAAVGFAVGTVCSSNPTLPKTVAVEAVLARENTHALGILHGLSGEGAFRYHFSDRVKALDAVYGTEVRTIWASAPPNVVVTYVLTPA